LIIMESPFVVCERAAWLTIGEKPRNVLEGMPQSFTEFLNKADGQLYSLEFAARISKELKGELLKLLEENMRPSYEAAGWGWNEKKKLRELSDEEARFLLIRSKSDGWLVGFTHFRFLVEGKYSILYCYELQISKRNLRKGLGKRLMVILEVIARKFCLEWVMLTVLCANKDASVFYRSIGYFVDDTSPHMDLEFDGYAAPYEILSKKLT